MKQKLVKIGSILFALPFGIFGILHFINAGAMAGLVPGFIPGGIFWVYATGLFLVAAFISIVTGKHTYLASLLLAALLGMFILTIHIPGLIGGNQMAMPGLLKDMGLLGGALLVASLNSEE